MVFDVYFSLEKAYCQTRIMGLHYVFRQENRMKVKLCLRDVQEKQMRYDYLIPGFIVARQ